MLHRRVHHGTWGCLAVLIGSYLAYWDRRDWKDWLLREVLK